jgi:tetratricopeptide (TPR) repeat protein
MLKHIVSILCVILFLPVICLAGEVNVKALDKAGWINIETANFSVLTNADEKKAEEIVQELEDFQYFLALSLGYKQQNLSEKVPVIVAKNKGTFVSLGLPDNYAGLFVKGVDAYAIFVRCDGFQSSSKGGGSWGRSNVLHELVHLLFANSSLELALAPWYSEGIAEYFGTYIERKNEVIIGNMSILGSRFYSMLNLNGMIENVDTESLFKISRADLNITDTSRKHDEFLNRFYARSVAVVHYILADQDRIQQLNQYLYYIKIGVTVDRAFNIAFKTTFSEFDKKVNTYINGNTLNAKAFPLGKGGLEFQKVEYKINNITKQDAFGFLYPKISMLTQFLGKGNFVKFNYDLAKLYPSLVDKLLQQQLAENPENINVLLRFAFIYEMMERHKETIDIFERMLLLDGSQHIALNEFAWLLATVPDVGFRNPEKAVDLAEKAVALKRSPGYLDTLAEAYYAKGSIEMAIETIKEAISLDENNEYYKKQLEKFKAVREKP